MGKKNLKSNRNPLVASREDSNILKACRNPKKLIITDNYQKKPLEVASKNNVFEDLEKQLSLLKKETAKKFEQIMKIVHMQ